MASWLQGLSSIGASATRPPFTNTNASHQQSNPAYLLSCVHSNRKNIVLFQDDISSIRTDRELFMFLKSRISERRNRLTRILACRSITGIFFTKFHFSSISGVEIIYHGTESDKSRLTEVGHCDCLPPYNIVHPFPNAEYSCVVPVPLSVFPPVSPQVLVHMLRHPPDTHVMTTRVLSRIPKRTTGELVGGTDEPNDGWGLYFEEGWDFHALITVSFVVVTVASLLFGILWSVYESDIQGAFGVSAYMVAAFALILAFVLSKMA